MSDRSNRTAVEQVTPAEVEDVDQMVDAGRNVRDQVADLAADPAENNPITRADDVETEVAHLRRVSRFLDSSVRIPGTTYRFGADALSGLIPGVGDVLSAVFSIYIVYKAYLLGLSYATVARMGINIVLDTLIGIVPVLGDLFDIGWKANDRNVELLEQRGNELEPNQRDKWFAIAFVASPILLVVVSIVLLIGSFVVLL